jgi:hypothetical protein
VAFVSKSIHPRNHYLVDKSLKRGEKQNTCAARNDNRKGTLAFRQDRLGKRRVDMSGTMQRSKQPQAFKTPGSMRGW